MGTQTKQRTLATCLALFAIAMLMAAVTIPAKAWADEGWRSYTYRWWDSSFNTVRQETRSAYCLDINEGDDAKIGSGWYITAEDDDDIDTVFIEPDSTVNIIITDGKTQKCEGIHVPASSTLNIYGQSGDSGWLRSDEDEDCYAGIGGMDGDDGDANCGTINIYGGNVYAKGDDGSSGDNHGGAGIGGGYKGNGGIVRIYGGRVEAQGNSDAAGIGGGDHGAGGIVEIFGGTVVANGGSASAEGGAGIGGGETGSGGTIRIYGGNVTAKGGCDGAGIGGGDSGSGGTINILGGTVNATGNNSAGIGGGQKGNGGDITISGGTVTAKGDDAAGIGGGADGGNGGNITISGGTISATGDDAAGIGGGDGGGNSGTIKISGGEVTAIAGVNSAGIGGGYDGASETIEITGGTIKEAKGGSVDNSGGAGIGGGNGHNGGTIIISNANVTAQGGVDSAGIGGGDGKGAGDGCDGGNITISGSLNNTIKATGGNYAAGIGGGQYGNGGTVTINGGTVEATGGRDGAGIGGGEYGNGGKVTITGGKVTAKGSPGNKSFEGGAGIGGGDGTKGDAYGNGGEVTITGGEVIAQGGLDAAGIGGGDQGKGGTVNISGGTVTAKGGDYGSGIGGGDGDRDSDNKSHGDGGNVTITGNAHVTAIGGNSGAGIGSGEEGNVGGTVTIGTEGSSTGPTVIATGGKYAAGIGAGDAYVQSGNPNVNVAVKGADVTIYSGDVTATGGEDAAGIGGGEGGSNGTTKIYGGTVTATAGQGGDNDGGAGIGSGDDCIRELSVNRKNTTGGIIEIHGGHVTATGGADGAGIGGGDYGSGGNITISGGTVVANGGAYAAGIGGGECRGAGRVTITGGNIRATGGSDSESKYGGAGIGGGANIANRTSEQNNDNTLGGPDQGQAIGEDVIDISGNCTVVANGGVNAAGIGGGTAGGPGSVTISVGTNNRVDATGGIHGAGIGGGAGKDGEGVGNTVNYGISGKITINSGIITATGGAKGGSGIGSGAACGDPSKDTVDVTINGGTVTARAGDMGNEATQYDAGVAIGTGGQYLGDELNDVEIDEGFVIKDVDKPAKFKGTIRFNGGRVVAYAATAGDDVDDYLKGALGAIGTSRSSSLNGGSVKFNGSTVWMWNNGFVTDWTTNAKNFSQAVRASENGISFNDSVDYQHVWYVETPDGGEDFEDSDVKNTSDDETGIDNVTRLEALTKYDKDQNNYGLVVVEPQHTHDFRYTLASSDSDNGLVNDTIVATCQKETCTLDDHEATLQIVKPRHHTYGDGLETGGTEKATLVDSFHIQGDSKIEYYMVSAAGELDGDELKDDEGAPAPPIGAGNYRAQIRLGEGNNTATAHVDYTIAKAENPTRVSGYAGVNVVEGEQAGFVDLGYCIKPAVLTDYELDLSKVRYTISNSPANDCSMHGDILYATSSDVGKTVQVNVHVPGNNNYEDLDATIQVTVTQKPVREIDAEDKAVTYGRDKTVYVYAEIADSSKRDSSDKYDYMVEPGYEDYIEEVGDNSETDGTGLDDLGSDDSGKLNLGQEFKIKKAGVAYVLVTVRTQSANYAPLSYKEIKVTINPANATITAIDESIEQGGTLAGKYSVDGLVGDVLTTEPTLTYKNGDKVVNPQEVGPGTYDIVPSGADSNGSYNFTYKPGKLTVKSPSPVEVASLYPLVIAGGNAIDLKSSIYMNGAKGAVHYQIVGDALGSTVNEDGTFISGDKAGLVNVSVTVDADDKYSAMKTKTLTVWVIPKRPQIITAPAVSATYGDTGKAVRAVVESYYGEPGAITYAVADGYEGYIEVDETTGELTILNVPDDGVVYVTATAAENSTNNPGTVDIPVYIEKKQLVIKAEDLRSFVGDPVPDLSYFGKYTAIGLLEGDSLDAEPSLRYEKGGLPTIPSTVIGGTYDIVPSGAYAQNYTISYENGMLTVKDRQTQAITASDMYVTYGETGKYVSATTNGDGSLWYIARGDAVEVNSSTGELTINRPGTAYIAILAEGTETYMPITREIKVTVGKAQLTVTAKDEQIFAGGTPEGFYDVAGLVGTDVMSMVTPTLTYQQNGVAIDPKTAPAGNYDIVPSGVDVDGKYTVSYVNGTLTVRADQAITASDMTVTYGDKGKYVKAATSGDGALSYAVKEGGDFVDVNSSTGELVAKRAGTAVITVTAAETSTHARAAKDIVVTVNKKQATVQADDQAEYIGNITNVQNIELTATVSGAVPGDTLAYNLSCNFGDVLQAGSYPISVTADPNVVPNYNYEITMKSGWFSVTDVNVSVDAKGWSSPYDGQPHGINVEVGGVPEGTGYAVKYGTKEGTYDSDTSPTQTDVGSLTVYYQVTVGSNNIIGSKDVIVEKATITPSVSITGWQWGEQPNAPVLAEGSNPGNAKVTYEYAHKGGSDWSTNPPTAYGDYTVLATISETANHLGGTATADFKVAPVQGELSFDLAGGTLGDKTGTVTVTANCSDTIKLPAAPTQDGYTFKNWVDSSGAYAAGADYTVAGNHAFTAEWEKQVEPDPVVTKATLGFDAAGGIFSGGTSYATIETTVGATVNLLDPPARDGYAFRHWVNTAGAVYAAGVGYAVTGNDTFTAVWEEQSIPGPSGDAWTYTCTGGAGSAWTEGSNGEIVFTFKRAAIGDEGDTTFEHFVSASVDGKPIMRDIDYTAQKGSVIIALKRSFLDTLNSGPHTITAHFDDGDSSVAFTTVEKNQPGGTAGGESNGSTAGGTTNTTNNGGTTNTTNNTTNGGSTSTSTLGGAAGTTTVGGTAGTSTTGGTAGTTNTGGNTNTTIVGGSAGTATTGGTATTAAGSSSSENLAKTSDSTMLMAVGVLAFVAVAACCAAAAAFRFKRRKQ